MVSWRQQTSTKSLLNVPWPVGFECAVASGLLFSKITFIKSSNGISFHNFFFLQSGERKHNDSPPNPNPNPNPNPTVGPLPNSNLPPSFPPHHTEALQFPTVATQISIHSPNQDPRRRRSCRRRQNYRQIQVQIQLHPRSRSFQKSRPPFRRR